MPRVHPRNRHRRHERALPWLKVRPQREIARKGGASVPGEKRSFSQDRRLAAEAGRKGGEASHGARPRVTPTVAD